MRASERVRLMRRDGNNQNGLYFQKHNLRAQRGSKSAVTRAPKALPRKLLISAVYFIFFKIVRATKVLERKQTQKTSLSGGAIICYFRANSFRKGRSSNQGISMGLCFALAAQSPHWK